MERLLHDRVVNELESAEGFAADERSRAGGVDLHALDLRRAVEDERVEGWAEVAAAGGRAERERRADIQNRVALCLDEESAKSPACPPGANCSIAPRVPSLFRQ